MPEDSASFSVHVYNGLWLMQSLHKNHALAANVHMTGDASIGYTMHLRPKDGGVQAVEALRRFMDLVNGSRPPAAHQRTQSEALASCNSIPGAILAHLYHTVLSDFYLRAATLDMISTQDLCLALASACYS